MVVEWAETGSGAEQIRSLFALLWVVLPAISRSVALSGQTRFLRNQRQLEFAARMSLTICIWTEGAVASDARP
jgi:hypothetical protein